MIGAKNRLYVFTGVCIALGMLACQPVIAIGWREGFFIFILIGILFGPPVYRFIRRIEEFRKQEKKGRDHDAR